MRREDEPMTYRYLGDGMTDPALRGARCEAVRRHDGKCIRGRGNMLVAFDDGRPVVVLARYLRKIQNEPMSDASVMPEYFGTESKKPGRGMATASLNLIVCMHG